MARTRSRLVSIAAVLIILVALVGFAANPFRCDMESGSHRIKPTAVDQTFVGHYKVYFRSGQFETNSMEDFYWIEKDDGHLVDSVKSAIANGQEIFVEYDKYVGFKGFFAPDTAPITAVSIVEME